MEEALPTPQPVGEGQTLSPVLIWFRRVVCVSMSVLGICVIAKLGGRLYGELRALSAELANARNREPMGYVGISAEQPEIKPPSCVREQDGRVYLWAGSGVKERQVGWFDVSATDLPLRQFTYAFGRDRVRAIDYPIVQTADGEIARRIYPERPVLGLEINGIARAYPITVMDKVEVVNDMFGDRAIAMTFCPLIRKPAVYDRTLDGESVSLGSSGYCYQDVFVLYDRRTDSLWYPRDEGLTAITGKLVGKTLPLLSVQADETTWGDWLRRNPDTEIVVGADRTRGIPLPEPSEVATRSL